MHAEKGFYQKNCIIEITLITNANKSCLDPNKSILIRIWFILPVIKNIADTNGNLNYAIKYSSRYQIYRMRKGKS